MNTHDLRHLDMSDAYDRTQWDDTIKHGDLLLVADGIAVMDRAWPVMLEGESEVFHMALNPQAIIDAQTNDEERNTIIAAIAEWEQSKPREDVPFVDQYAEHLEHSAPCASRWDGFDRGDNGDIVPDDENGGF